MRPYHLFLILIFLALAAAAAWFWMTRETMPVEVEIAMEQPAEPIPEPVPSEVPVISVQPESEPEPAPPIAAEEPFSFSDDDCRWLTRHIPDADVAYKPGVDVYGKPVVPADLNGTYDFELPETVVASVSRRLLGHRNLEQQTSFAEIEIDIATGAIWINGKGLDNEEQERLVAWCRARP